MKRISVKKGDVLQIKGALNSKVYFVEKGLLRSYSVDKKGKEHIFMFAPEGWTIADNNAPDVPSELFIDALEDSIITVSIKDDKRESLNAGALIRRISVLQKRVIMLMSATAIERYDHFVKTYPDITQRVPQKIFS